LEAADFADFLGHRLGSRGQRAPTGLYFGRAERAVIDGNLVDEAVDEETAFCLPDGQGGVRIGDDYVGRPRTRLRSVHVNGGRMPVPGLRQVVPLVKVGRKWGMGQSEKLRGGRGGDLKE